GCDPRYDTIFAPWEPAVMPRPPASYLSPLYLDTVSPHPPAVQCAVDTVGVDHVVYGSDFPPVPIPLKRSVDVVHQLKISKEDKQKILGDTAAKLLGLSG